MYPICFHYHFFFAMQWIDFSLLLKDFSVSDSSRRSCPLGSDSGLRIESGLMDLTEVWGKSHWLRVGASTNQVGQVQKVIYMNRKRDSEQVERRSPTASLLGDTEQVSGSPCESDVLSMRQAESRIWKRKLNFIKLLHLESLQHA